MKKRSNVVKTAQDVARNEKEGKKRRAKKEKREGRGGPTYEE